MSLLWSSFALEAYLANCLSARPNSECYRRITSVHGGHVKQQNAKKEKLENIPSAWGFWFGTGRTGLDLNLYLGLVLDVNWMLVSGKK